MLVDTWAMAREGFAVRAAVVGRDRLPHTTGAGGSTTRE